MSELRRVVILSCAVILLLWGVGCNQQTAVEPAGAETADSTSSGAVGELPRAVAAPVDEPVDRAMAEDLAGGRLPLQFPGSGADEAEVADDVADVEGSGTGLLDVLRQTVDLSPIFGETGVQEGLSEGLLAAQDELSRQKRENRNAIREANRQVRVGLASQSPNLVLISVEGLGYGDLSCYGQSRYATTNVDRLAERGLRFTNFYAGSAQAGASRWCLMTGHNTGRAAVVDVAEERFTLSSDVDDRVLPDVLWNSGYTTGLVGVWDERVSPLDYGYDQWSGFQAASGVFDSYPDAVYLDATRARLPANSDGGQGVHAGDLLLQESLSFLRRHASGPRPCFLHVAMPVFETASNEGGGDMPATVAELDRMIGGVLDWLDEGELAGRTCVMLMGVSAPGEEQDGGQAGRTAELNVHESGLYEGNLRVPLIVCWDGRIAQGGVNEHVCAAWDVLPTLADLAVAMRRPQRLDGLSIAGSLLGGNQPQHRLLYWETREHGFGQAVRMGNWKGVRLPRQTNLSLYDLTADPGEQQDLSDERPEIVVQLVVRD